MALNIPSKQGRRWDLVALGEVMLRFDPGETRIHTARTFRVWEGGGEYNVARGLRRCFGLDTALVTALADNPVGRLDYCGPGVSLWWTPPRSNLTLAPRAWCVKTTASGGCSPLIEKTGTSSPPRRGFRVSFVMRRLLSDC